MTSIDFFSCILLLKNIRKQPPILIIKNSAARSYKVNRVHPYQKTRGLLCILCLKAEVLTILALIDGIFGLVGLRPKGRGMKPNKNHE